VSSVFWLHIVTYIAALIFVGVSIAKAVKYATMPIHLRWELYPIAHEKGREHGGSHFEELDWWTKPRHKSLLGEIKYMVKEIFLFLQVYHRNRGLWYFTYPFHIGLLLLIAWLFLLLIGALTVIAGIPVSTSGNVWGILVYYFTLITGIVGLVLGTFGCIGLLVKRSIDEDLKPYTQPADYFNLSFILVIFLSGISVWFYDSTFSVTRDYVVGLLTFSPLIDLNPMMPIGIILFSLFLIYMPFTSMMHGLAKYFTYHSVRWDDAPILTDSKKARKIAALLNKPVSWTAPHIQSGKTWSEVAKGMPEDTT